MGIQNYNKNKLEQLTPVIMLVPALLGIFIVHIYPSLNSIRMSFFDINLLKPDAPFIGLKNYISFLKTPTIWRVTLNTFIFASLSLMFAAVLSLALSLALNKKFLGRGFLRALYLAPWVTPPLVTSIVWRILLNETFSPLNSILMNLNIIDKPINILGQVDTYLGIFSLPMLALIVINVWSIFPFMTVMFLAGLQTIPNDLYEAADIDGASKWSILKHITIPSLLPVISITMILQGIWQFNSFNLSYLVAKGGPLNLTEVLAVRVYSEAFVNFRYGYSAAISVFMFLIVLIPSIIYIKSLNKED